ncbi:MAG TPA: 5-(carboxyamino)imidazole ribonucleotide mutase [bacterium]|nr:5-(carboxyamino)imidazole ribonucleotide mutase [bacterium]
MSKQTTKQAINPQVGIIMGSDSDLETVVHAAQTLDNFGVPSDLVVASAHRSPALVTKTLRSWEKAGVQVVIAAAGCAAHLPGVVASQTYLPVIGVPLAAPPFNGMDSVLSILPMPGGIPVATMAVGKPGVINAALFAVRILALHNPILGTKLASHIKDMERSVVEKNKKLKSLGAKAFLAQRGK